MTSRLVPLTIGVIGHRELLPADHDRIVAQMRSVVASYRLRFPASPLVVMTALAEGADQLAVNACHAIEGVTIMAVLPMPIADYERDFTQPGSLERFRHLLTTVETTVTVDKLLARDSIAPAWPEVSTNEGRTAAYQRCARFISDQSHVLMAVWDGRPPELVAGTADTVHYRFSSANSLPGSQSEVILWPAEGGILIQIPVGDLRLGTPSVDQPGQLPIGIVHRLGDLAEVSEWAGPQDDTTAAFIDRLNIRIALGAAQGESCDTITQAVMHVADADAAHLQSNFRRLAASVLLAGVAALMIVNIEQNLMQTWLLGSAAIAIAVTGTLWWALSRVGVKDRFQQARTLAEGARVQQAWLETGVRACPSDFFLLGQDDVAWIRRVLRSAWLLDRTSIPNRGNPIVAAREWMQGQLEYFQGSPQQPGAIVRNRRKALSYDRLALTGIALAFIGILLEATRIYIGATASAAIGGAGQVLWELGLATVAASAAYGQLRAFREIERQFQSSSLVYQQGYLELSRTNAADQNPERARAIAFAVGAEALRESSSWLALNRDRSVRPV
jgi:hypothetical protein